MENKYYVYEWYNTQTGLPFYVGKGTGDRYKRIKGRNQYFKNYINKYSVSQRILKDNLTQKQAFDLQKKMIRQYKDKNITLTNLTNGGQGCPHMQVTEEYRMKYHSMFLGQNNPNYGHRWTEEMKKHLSEYKKGKYSLQRNPNAKAIICVQTGQEFKTLKQAATKCNCKSYTSISHALNRPNKTAYGYHWKTI